MSTVKERIGENMIDSKTDAILVVDLQNDFITGSLAVPGAENMLPTLKKWVDRFAIRFTSRDWHPPDHSSFIDQDGPWPPHCVEDTEGAHMHSILDGVPFIQIYKGKDIDKEQYSAFDGTNLASLLGKLGIKRLFVCGLATDYCVKATVLDALEQFDGEVYVLLDAIAGVNVNVGDADAAIVEMTLAGAKLAANADKELLATDASDIKKTFKKVLEEIHGE
jgi:nicotinamidase-related amidase